jgi:hypothetical protein
MLLLLFMIQPLRKRQWSSVRWLACFAVLVSGFYLLLSSIPHSVYRLTIDRRQGDLHSEEFSEKDRKLLSEWHLRISDVASIEMKYNRGDSTILLVGRDGELSYPLGETTQQNAPTQFIVLNALRQTLQQDVH